MAPPPAPHDELAQPGLVIALVVVFVVLSLASPYFFTTTNLLNIAKAGSPRRDRCRGPDSIIIGGASTCPRAPRWPPPACSRPSCSRRTSASRSHSGAALALGALVGVVNGTIVSRFRINPLIATLATFIVRGSRSSSRAARRSSSATRPGSTSGPTPSSASRSSCLLLATFLVLRLGDATHLVRPLHVCDIGSNARAARLAGIAVDRWRLLIYTVAMDAPRDSCSRPDRQRAPGRCRGLRARRHHRGHPRRRLAQRRTRHLAGTFVGLLLIGVINNGPTSRRCPPIGRAS